jgi:glycine hydroxymethyltransferase
MLSAIKQNDRVVFDLIKAEQVRQGISIRMIPSENYVSRAVMQATGSCLTNNRAKELFGAEAANVQTHSGSPANLATYCALAEPGATIMGLALPHGGHLTHGWKVSYTGKFFNSVQYELDPETGRLRIRVRLILPNSRKLLKVLVPITCVIWHTLPVWLRARLT